MDEHEHRITEALRALPEPEATITERARARALGAIGRPAHRRWPLLAGTAAAAAVGGAGLATVGVITLRDEPQPVAITGAVVLPPELAGVAVTIDGRAWVRTKDGFAIEGLRADTVELSPNARFVAAGIGRSLVALTPNHATAWRVPTTGRVTAIRWAPNPNPIYVAYVVRRGADSELRLVEGDGDHDRAVAPGVDPATPVWNPEPLQVWFSDREGLWQIYEPATDRTAPTKPAGPDPARATARARAAAGAAGHPEWVERGSTATDEGALVAVGPAVEPGAAPAGGPLEVWWVPVTTAGKPVRVLRASAPFAASVTLSARPR